MQIVIYALLDPITGAPRYIGKSKQPRRRLNEHMRAQTKNRHLLHWLAGLKAQGRLPVLRILEECRGDWEPREQWWIRYLRRRGYSLVNLTPGGDDPPHLRGVRHPNHKLTEDQVLELRRRYYAEPINGAELAREYGLAHHAVWQILRRRTWAHLPLVHGETGLMLQKPNPRLMGEHNPDSRLTASQVHAIRYRYAAEAKTVTELAHEYGVVHNIIGLILNRKLWASLPIGAGEATRCRTTQETAVLRGHGNRRSPEANAARAQTMRDHWARIPAEERAPSQIEVPCDGCGSAVRVWPSQARRSEHLFCGRECYRAFRRRADAAALITRPCALCGAPVQRPAWGFTRSEFIGCCQSHAHRARAQHERAPRQPGQAELGYNEGGDDEQAPEERRSR